MNKNKTILLSIAGVIALASAVMAYLDWSAYSAKTAALEGDDMEGIEGLESVIVKAEKLSRKEIYPSAESVKAIEEKIARLEEWQKEAKRLASRGDKVFAKTTPAAFKEFIVTDAKRLSQLPGDVGGALVKSEFTFGPFKEYIAEGKMPAESELAKLQRQWDDVSVVVEKLAECQISELLDIQIKAKVEPKEEPKQNARRQRQQRKAAAKVEAPKAKEPVAHTYVVTFASRGPGIVKAVNAFSTAERFIVVEDLAFSREKDGIAEALAGDEKKADDKSSRRSRRSRRALLADDKKSEEAEKKSGIVTDPMLDQPLKAVMTLSIYDFGSLEDDSASGQQKGEAK